MINVMIGENKCSSFIILSDKSLWEKGYHLTKEEYMLISLFSPVILKPLCISGGGTWGATLYWHVLKLMACFISGVCSFKGDDSIKLSMMQIYV